MQFPLDFAPLLITAIGCVLWFVARETAGRSRADRHGGSLNNDARREPQSEARDRFQAVRLDRSSLCVDCQTVNESPGDTCYVCGATGSLLSLARVLDGHITAALPKTKADSLQTGQLKILGTSMPADEVNRVRLRI